MTTTPMISPKPIPTPKTFTSQVLTTCPIETALTPSTMKTREKPATKPTQESITRRRRTASCVPSRICSTVMPEMSER